MGGVGRAEGTEKELGTEEGQVVLDGEEAGLEGLFLGARARGGGDD